MYNAYHTAFIGDHTSCVPEQEGRRLLSHSELNTYLAVLRYASSEGLLYKFIHDADYFIGNYAEFVELPRLGDGDVNAVQIAWASTPNSGFTFYQGGWITRGLFRNALVKEADAVFKHTRLAQPLAREVVKQMLEDDLPPRIDLSIFVRDYVFTKVESFEYDHDDEYAIPFIIAKLRKEFTELSDAPVSWQGQQILPWATHTYNGETGDINFEESVCSFMPA